MTGTSTDQLQTQSLGEQLAEIVARQIVTREIQPHTRLGEEELGRRFGVSRTPARDAMRILAQEHLVTLLPRRGAEVIEISAQRVIDLYVIRSRLHGLAVSLVVTRADESGLGRFETPTERMQAAAEADDVDAFVKANMAFHELAERLADNAFLTSSLATLGRLTVHLRRRGLELPGRLERSAEAHRTVHAAMVRRDALAAEAHTCDLILDAGVAILRADFPEDHDVVAMQLQELRATSSADGSR
jgi:DNA-binding GntR family transcriptional regulator